MVIEKTVKISEETYQLLTKLQRDLPGKPSYKSLIHDALKLLADKYGV